MDIAELLHSRSGRALLVLIPTALLAAAVLIRALILARRAEGKTSRPPDA